MGRCPLAAALVVSGLALASPARAADEPPAPTSAERGFGERGSTLLSLEGVFTLQQQDITSTTSTGSTNDTSDRHIGFLSPGAIVGGPRLGVSTLLHSGLTLGVVGGFWVESAGFGGTCGNATLTDTQLGPRIGFAGAMPKAKKIGYWLRGGPSFVFITINNPTCSNGVSTSGNNTNVWLIDLSLEAFLVWSPVEHFGVLAGPTVDFGLAGHSSPSSGQGQDAGYHIAGLSLGLVFDL